MIDSCGDCGCNEGEIHNFFSPEDNNCCDMEMCPICKGQLLSCDCDKNKITEEIREPYLNYTTWFCCRCSKTDFPMVIVSKNEWEYICGKTYPLDCVLCKECMNFIKNARDKLKGVKG